MTNLQENTQEYWDNHIDNLIDLMDSVEQGKVTILTGPNGSGKSMVRKLLAQFISKNFGVPQKSCVASVSMDIRAGINSSLGHLQMFQRDCEWLPTSQNTMNNVKQCLSVKGRYIVLDEIEIGVGEELQAGMCMELNTLIEAALTHALGVMVITHSRTVVKYLKHDVFMNTVGMTEEEWMNREIVPMSITELEKKSSELHAAFSKRLRTSDV